MSAREDVFAIFQKVLETDPLVLEGKVFGDGSMRSLADNMTSEATLILVGNIARGAMQACFHLAAELDRQAEG